MNDMFISLQKTENLIDEIFMQTKEPSQSKWLPGGQQKEGIQFAPQNPRRTQVWSLQAAWKVVRDLQRKRR